MNKDFEERYEGMKFKINYPVLDIGGGDGKFLEYNKVTDAVIIDLTKDKNQNYTYLNQDISKKITFPDFLEDKYKTIFVMETLEHLNNPMYLMSQVYDFLEDDGVCYISIPYTKLDSHYGQGMEHDNGHVNRWTTNQIIRELKQLGFKPKVIQHRRRFKGLGIWLPKCWLVLEVRK